MKASVVAIALGTLLLQAVSGLAIEGRAPVENESDDFAVTSSRPNTCCSQLSSALGKKLVHLPSSSGFNTSMEGFWTLQTTFDTPNCIVRPACASDVAVAVKGLVKGNCKFSVKGGGHTPFKGAASISNGVIIDMTAIDGVSVNSQKNVASIGAGARWLKIYTELQAQSLMVAGGRDSDVGIGGLITGGGYSWFTSTMGFVADGLVNVELVTAEGKIINVNAKSNADLFVGIKGGGNNFGIVTRFDLKAFPFTTMWGGLKVYPNTTADAHIKAFINFNNKAHTDTSANVINFFSYSSTDEQHILSNVLDYTKPVANAPIYDEMNAIPGLIADTTRIAPLSSFTEELSSAQQRERNIFETLTFTNSEVMYKKAVDISNHYLKPFLKTQGLTWSLLFQPIPAIIHDISRANGGNIMGVDRNKENLILYLLYISWTDEKDDAALNAAAAAAIAEIKSTMVQTGTDNPYIYLNYAGKDANVLAGYGAANVKKMQALSTKYDRDGVFQKLVPGGWKINSAKTL